MRMLVTMNHPDSPSRRSTSLKDLINGDVLVIGSSLCLLMNLLARKTLELIALKTLDLSPILLTQLTLDVIGIDGLILGGSTDHTHGEVISRE